MSHSRDMPARMPTSGGVYRRYGKASQGGKASGCEVGYSLVLSARCSTTVPDSCAKLIVNRSTVPASLSPVARRWSRSDSTAASWARRAAISASCRPTGSVWRSCGGILRECARLRCRCSGWACAGRYARGRGMGERGAPEAL